MANSSPHGMPGAYGHGCYGVAVLIRPARPDEVDALAQLEMAAGAPFADAGMHDVAAMSRDPQSLVQFVAAGDAWVADVDGRAAGYIIVEPVDGCLHIEQVSVHPDFMRRGFGSALLDHVATTARERGYPAVTLTTFRDLPWNGPFYQRNGYRILSADEETPGLRSIRAHEASLGLDRWPRCCMRRDL
jgi:ribosomal protein S18 acetylase RimI-like enzyme